MKRLVIVALLGLSSCGVLRDGGEAVCSAQEETAEILTKGAESIGLFGVAPVAADLVNMGLEFFCAVFNAVASAPAAVGTELGIPPVGEAAPDVEDPGL